MAFTQPQCGLNFPAHSWGLSQTYRWPWHCLPIKSLLTQWKSPCTWNSSLVQTSGSVQFPQRTHPERANCSMGCAYCATFCQMFAAHRPCVPSVCTKEPRTVAAGQGENWACSSISSCSSLLSWRPLKTFAMLRAWSGCPQQLALSKREADLQRWSQASASSSLAANLFKRYSWQNLDGACLMPSHLHVLLLEQLGTYLFTHWVLKKTTLKNTFSQGDQHWVSALSLRFLPPQPPSSLSEGREQGQCMELLLREHTDNFPYL